MCLSPRVDMLFSDGRVWWSETGIDPFLLQVRVLLKESPKLVNLTYVPGFSMDRMKVLWAGALHMFEKNVTFQQPLSVW